jgi:hypothetical protein
MATECPDCGKLFSKRRCSCGFEPEKLRQLSQAELCPFDGTRLDPSGPFKGFCERGGGYPVSLICAFACPLCGKGLGWSGGCHGCHGTRSGQREDWTFPGDGYYTHSARGEPIGDGMHYVKDQGPRLACSRAENVLGAKALGRILSVSPVNGK